MIVNFKEFFIEIFIKNYLKGLKKINLLIIFFVVWVYGLIFFLLFVFIVFGFGVNGVVFRVVFRN